MTHSPLPYTKSWFVGIIALLAISSGHAFDYARYQPGNLDVILSEPRPTAGLKALAPQKLRLEVTLTAYAQSCDTRLLKKTMVMLGAPKESVEKVPISKCIEVKSPQGRASSVYIQDRVATYLPKEVPLGTSLTIFVDYLFVDKIGPGILVNEFERMKK